MTISATKPTTAGVAAPLTTPASNADTPAKSTDAANEVRAATDAGSTFETSEVGGKKDDKRPTFLPERQTVHDKLKDPNYFGELDEVKQVPTTESLLQWKGSTLTSVIDPAQPEKSGALETLYGAGNAFFSGDLGRANATRLISRSFRTDGDFRYAFGEETFRAWMKADEHLNEIPRGKFADALSLDLLREVSVLSYVHGEEPLLERLGHKLRQLQGREIVPGQLRDYSTQTTPFELSAEEIAKIEANGCEWKDVASPDDVSDDLFDDDGKDHGVIVYPDASTLAAGLNALIEETKAGLRDPNSDIVQVAANFSQEFAALHPFQDGNGRIGRLIMDRILAERGLPPPILKSQSEDVSLTPEEYKAEVAHGIARMNTVLSKASKQGFLGSMEYTQTLFRSGAKTDLPKFEAPANQPIRIGSMPFAQGPDGFVYDMAGRPHLVDDSGTLQPMAQLTYYMAMRRVIQTEDPQATLTALTAQTRETFAKLAADPALAKKTQVPSDADAIAADNEFHVKLPKSGNDALIALFDPSKSTPQKLFGPVATSAAKTEPSFAMSRYLQIDLEMVHVQNALERSGDDRGAKQMEGHRAQLFDLAKQYLQSKADPTRASSENPLGFSKHFEKVMYDHSPLRFPTFQDAENDADRRMAIWRGDLAVVQYTGIFPDNSPNRPDSRALAEFRGDRGGTANIFAELDGVAGKSGGTGYQCYTSNLGLLAQDGGFADKANKITVDISALPGPIRNAISSRLDAGETLSIDDLKDLGGFALDQPQTIPEGHLDVAGVSPEVVDQKVERALQYVTGGKELIPVVKQRIAEAREKAERGGNLFDRLMSLVRDEQVLVKLDDVVKDAPKTLPRIQDELTLERDYLTLRRQENTPNKVEVSAHRRAFLIDMDREDGIPGPTTLGGTFEREQEITGIERMLPWRVKQMFTQEDLDRDLPVINPAAAPATAPKA